MPTHGCIKCGYGIPGCCICLNHEHTTRGTNESVTKPFGVSTTDLTLVNLGNLGLAMEDTNLRAVSACEVLGQIFAREIGNVLTHIKQHGIYIDEQKLLTIAENVRDELNGHLKQQAAPVEPTRSLWDHLNEDD